MVEARMPWLNSDGTERWLRIGGYYLCSASANLTCSDKEKLIGVEVVWKLFGDDIGSSEEMDTSTEKRSKTFFFFDRKTENKSKIKVNKIKVK